MNEWSNENICAMAYVSLDWIYLLILTGLHILLEQWFSNLKMYQNHLEGLLKHILLAWFTEFLIQQVCSGFWRSTFLTVSSICQYWWSGAHMLRTTELKIVSKFHKTIKPRFLNLFFRFKNNIITFGSCLFKKKAFLNFKVLSSFYFPVLEVLDWHCVYYLV